jgi:hypothetical protein
MESRVIIYLSTASARRDCIESSVVCPVFFSVGQALQVRRVLITLDITRAKHPIRRME